MQYIDESLAKGIVKRDLRNFHSTDDIMKKVMFTLFDRDINHPKNIIKVVPKILKKHGSTLYHYGKSIAKGPGFTIFQVPRGVTSLDGYKGYKKQRSRRRKVEFTIYKGSLSTSSNHNCLSIFIFGMTHYQSGYGDEIVTITNHALVRMVQRMQCDSLDDVLKELSDSSEMILHAYNEFHMALLHNSTDPGVSRYVPTKNGVAVMRVDTERNLHADSSINLAIVTWISNSQLYERQKITQRELALNQIASGWVACCNGNGYANQLFESFSNNPEKETYIRRGDHLFQLDEIREKMSSGNIEEALSF